MMHISPCGWYCFEGDFSDVTIEDTPDKTIISPPDQNFQIELLSARKTNEAIDDEISRIHEDYLNKENIIPNKTILSENNFGLKFYVTQGTGMDEKFWIICHAFWNNYCVFIQYTGKKDLHSSIGKQRFYDILNRLQPLATE